MRHLLVVNVYFAPRSYGGATVVAEELARRLAAGGEWRVSVLSFSAYGSSARPVLTRTAPPNDAGGTIDHYTLNLGGGPAARDLAFDNPAMTAEIARLIAHLAPDAAHVHCIQNLGVGVIDALSEAGVPILLSTHDYWWLCERSFMVTEHGRFCGQEVIDRRVCAHCVENAATLDARWEKALATLKKPAIITYPSRHARVHHERNGAPAETGAVLPNGVAPPGPDSAAVRAARPSRRLRFAYIGGPGPAKGWPMLERAFRALDPERAELNVVEAAPHVGANWWGGYRFGPLARHVTVTPSYTRETADAFWAGIDVLLFLSQWPETFGLTTREAALRGVHVVATECGAPIEPLTDGETATILPGFGDVRALRRALTRLVAEGPPAPSAEARAKLVAQVRSFDEQAGEISGMLDRISVGR